MRSRDLQVRRDDLTRTRVVESSLPRVGPGQALLRVDAFGLTANNITYALLGDSYRYWDFFPAGDGWGRVPAWGHATVLTAPGTPLEAGDRVFGFVPMGSHLVVTVARGGQAGFTDRSPHRAALPAAYNHYRPADSDPVRDRVAEDLRMTVWPLFFTSFLLADLLSEHRRYGAGRVVVSSASSRTALGLAHLLPDIEVFGLTSAANRARVAKLGVYDAVFAYDEIPGLPGGDAVFLDFAGDPAVARAVHGRYADTLRASIRIGATHGAVGEPGALPGPEPWFFLSPDRISDRARTWGVAELTHRVGTAWRAFRPTAEEWFPSRHHSGARAARQVYLDLRHGRVEPGVGHVVSLG